MKFMRNVVLLALCVVLISVAPAEAFAPQDGPGLLRVSSDVRVQPDTRVLGSLAAFRSESPGVWTVRWNDRTGVPRSILGKGNKRYRINDPVEIAKTFLRETADMFRSENGFADLSLDRVLTSGQSRHVHFAQEIDGIPLFQCGLSVHISPKGEVRQVNGEYVPRPEIKGTWALTDKQALEAALGNISGTRATGRPAIEKVLYFDGSSARRAWQVRMTTDIPLGAWEMVVDGADGKVLYRSNYVDFATGTGSVYDLHPLAGDPVLKDLLYMKALTALKSKFVTVKNEDEREASDPDGRYVYDPENTHFDEVMVYYQIIVIHDYFAGLGFHSLDKRAPGATVHVGDDYDNAYFHPWFNGFYFGDGNKLNDLAKEANVVHHEYTHAVTGKIVSLRGGEAGAMNEAFSDYFACTQDDDPLIGEYVCSRLPLGYLRNMENELHYPEDIEGEVHHDGKIYGATLWDLRKALGKDVTDMLAHVSRYHMRSGAKFVGGLEGLVAADLDLYNGVNEETIRRIFATRGIQSNDRMLDDQLIEKRFYKLLEKYR